MQLPTFDREERLISESFLPVGVDEAGRGPLAGPVVACATLYKTIDDRRLKLEIEAGEDKRWRLVRDSKKLSPKQRDEAFLFVQEQFHVGVGVIGPETIDRVNILEATFLAIRAAISELRRIMNHELGTMEEDKITLLIDGNQEIPNVSLQQEAIVDGDALVRSIAAASIVAKVTRDRIIVELDRQYPGYGLARHKGYGTKEHMDALRRLGPSPIHRMSFEPVRMSLPENVNRKLATLAKWRRS